MVTDSEKRAYDLLHRMPSDGLPAAKQLFCTELNYHHANQPLSYRGWPDRARGTLSGPPTILARHESQFGDFDIIHATLSPEWRGRTFPILQIDRSLPTIRAELMVAILYTFFPRKNCTCSVS